MCARFSPGRVPVTRLIRFAIRATPGVSRVTQSAGGARLKPDGDGRSPPRRARQLDGSPPALDQPLRDGEAQTRAARGGGERRLEDPRPRLCPKAPPLVLHRPPAAPLG